MFIDLPDPHPGRCKNHRYVFVDGYPDSLRCLDYEGTPHVCSFPTPMNRTLHNNYHVWQGSQPVPQVWVKPTQEEPSHDTPADTRDPICVERWPECHSGDYNPACCRFPKSCSC
jgi:hypothetical protein